MLEKGKWDEESFERSEDLAEQASLGKESEEMVETGDEEREEGRQQRVSGREGGDGEGKEGGSGRVRLSVWCLMSEIPVRSSWQTDNDIHLTAARGGVSTVASMDKSKVKFPNPTFPDPTVVQ